MGYNHCGIINNAYLGKSLKKSVTFVTPASDIEECLKRNKITQPIAS